MENTKNITLDFEEWKSKTLPLQKEVEPDKLIYPEELKEVVTGYMTKNIGSANKQMMMATSYTLNSIKEAIDFLKKQQENFDVYIHQCVWRHLSVDGYTLNSVIVVFATTSKVQQ